MDLLLLSMNDSAVPAFLAECCGEGPIRLGYLPDAAEAAGFGEGFRADLELLGHEIVDLRARELDAAEFAALLDSVDAVYGSPGETFVLLEALQVNGCDRVLADRIRAGLPYIGMSAGSIIAGSSITPLELMDSRDLAPGLLSDDGLGLVDAVIVPHADGKIPDYPESLIRSLVETYGNDFNLLLLDDDQALRVSDEGTKVISVPRSPRP